MPHEITRYKCDFCNKHYSNKANAKRHENKCYHNPIMKACASCINLEKWEETVGCDETGYGTESGLYCACYDIQLKYWGWSKDIEHGLIFNCEYWKQK